MQIVFGTPVVTSDGHEIGTVDRLILDPDSGDLKVVVIRQGRLWRHDVEAPVAAFASDDGGVLRLTLTAAQAAALPRFVESLYTAEADNLTARGAVSGIDVATAVDPLYGAAIPDVTAASLSAGADWGVFLTEEHLNNAVVGDGSAVRDPDGHGLGTLRELVFDDARRLTRFVLRRGLLGHEVVTLPAALITAIDDGVMTLAVDGAWLESWAGVTIGMEVWTADAVALGTVSAREFDGLTVIGIDGSRYRVPARVVVGRMDQAITLDVARNQADALIVPA